MPSNAELIADIDALSNELGQTVNVTGLKNDQLAKLLSGLRDEKAARAETPAPGTAEQAAAEQAAAEQAAAEQAAAEQAAAEQAAAEQAAAPKPPYYMAPGKAVTSKIGILSGDTADEVKAEYFEGGDKTLKALVESGHVVES